MKALALGSLVVGVAGHATMTQPMSRGMYKKNKGPCPSPDGAIGCFEPWSAGGTGGYSPCGIVKGEDFTKKPFDLSMMNSADLIHSTLHAGGVTEFKSLFTAHHMGHVVYGICPDSRLAGEAYGNPPEAPPDCSTITDPVLKNACNADFLSPIDVWEPAKKLMDCFLGQGEWANHKDGAGLLLRSEDHEHLDPAPIDHHYPERWYIPPKAYTLDGQDGAAWPIGESHGVYTTYMKIPANLKCQGGKCLVHFFYYTANSCTGAGYSEYFSEDIGGSMHPRTVCTGGKCPTGQVNGRPQGSWAMNGNWWRSAQYPEGYCAVVGPVTDSPTNTWSRANPERFWNCADVYGPDGGSGGGAPTPPDPCAGVVCTPQDCNNGGCNSASGQCEYTAKSDGSSCSTICGACADARCQAGSCDCAPKAEGTLCSGGSCKSGVCETAPPPGPSPPTGVNCEATVSCEESTCSETCGGGVKTVTCHRTVTREPTSGGMSCDQLFPFAATVTENCNTQPCPEPPSPGGGGNCIGPAVEADGLCTPTPQTCDGIPRCCANGLQCCGNQWWAQCKAVCTGDETSLAAKQDGEGKDSKGLLALVAAVFGGSLCGGFVVFAALRKRSNGGSARAAPGPEELGTQGRAAPGTTSRVKATYQQQADI